MSLEEKVANSHLSQQEKLIMHLLAKTMDRPSVGYLVDCLVSEPYELDESEIYQALNSLTKKGLLELSHFSYAEMDIDTHITFAHDWVLKF